LRVGERNPKNAPGPFYVLRNECLRCGAPPAEAPDLVRLDDDDDDDDYGGCYFYKQPETEVEVEAAIMAMHVSCVEALRYGGTDPTIRRRLSLLGSGHLCDHPFPRPIFIRDRVTFCLTTTPWSEVDDANEVAKLVVAWFERARPDGATTKPITGDSVVHVTFDFTHCAKYADPRRYTITRISLARITDGAHAMIYRDPPHKYAWLLVDEESKKRGYPPAWLHDVLVNNGAAIIRWYSREEWNAGGPSYDRAY
jgi:hypothetical protein